MFRDRMHDTAMLEPRSKLIVLLGERCLLEQQQILFYIPALLAFLFEAQPLYLKPHLPNI